MHYRQIAAQDQKIIIITIIVIADLHVHPSLHKNEMAVPLQTVNCYYTDALTDCSKVHIDMHS